MPSVTSNSGETGRLLQQAALGDQEAWRLLLERHRSRLRRMIALRMDQRLQGRFDASDVIQDVYQEAWLRLPQYLDQAPAPFFLWLRYLTGQRLVELHRRHVGARKRDAGREVSLDHGALPQSSCAALADQLLGRGPGPSEAAVRAELKVRLEEALSTLSPLDREVLALRHFEHLSNVEAAQTLGLETSAASKRYLRALRRLKDILASMPGGLEELGP